MTIIVLDPHAGAQPPYPDWLADTGEDLVLITGRSAEDLDTDGYTEVRRVPDYASSATAELTVLELADATDVTALVATATSDLIRAGALRDHLGIAGQGREAAAVFADPVATRQRLLDAEVPAVRGGPVLRVSDLYWHRHRWGGGPVRVRHRKEPGWPTAAVLKDDADLRAFTENGLAPSLISVPSLMVEPHHEGERLVVEATADTRVWHAEVRTLVRRTLSALPAESGYPYRIEILHTADGAWLVDTVDSATATPSDTRDVVRVQAGLAPLTQEATRWAS